MWKAKGATFSSVGREKLIIAEYLELFSSPNEETINIMFDMTLISPKEL